jgi:hypothetical protein
VAMGALLNPEILTIGFVRRFAGYKRPALIFHDVDRLKRIVGDPWRRSRSYLPASHIQQIRRRSHPCTAFAPWPLIVISRARLPL